MGNFILWTSPTPTIIIYDSSWDPITQDVLPIFHDVYIPHGILKSFYRMHFCYIIFNVQYIDSLRIAFFVEYNS